MGWLVSFRGVGAIVGYVGLGVGGGDRWELEGGYPFNDNIEAAIVLICTIQIDVYTLYQHVQSTTSRFCRVQDNLAAHSITIYPESPNRILQPCLKPLFICLPNGT